MCYTENMKYTFLNREYELLGENMTSPSVKISDGRGNASILNIIDFYRWQYKNWPKVFGGVYRRCEVMDGYSTDDKKTFHKGMELLSNFERGHLSDDDIPVTIYYEPEERSWTQSIGFTIRMNIEGVCESNQSSGSSGVKYFHEQSTRSEMRKWDTKILILTTMYYNLWEPSWDGSSGSIVTTFKALEQHLHQHIYHPEQCIDLGIWEMNIIPTEINSCNQPSEAVLIL